MKNYKYILIGLPILLVTLILLVGCGVSQSEYDALQAQITTLEAEKQTLQNKYGSLQTENKAMQSEKNTLEAEKQSLKADYDKLSTEHGTLQAEFNALKMEKESLQTSYNAVSIELADIKKVYPPRSFSSLRELTDWLLTNDVSEKPDTVYAENTLARAYEIQEDALIDGYIISVDYDFLDDGTATIVCAAYINGTIFYWSPDDDITYEETYFSTIAW